MNRRFNGSKMRELREAMGVSQSKFAAMIGMERRETISEFENYRTNPSFDTVLRIADALGVEDINELLELHRLAG